MLLLSAALTSRLVFWQVLQHGHLSAMAQSEHAAIDVQTPLRGLIYDASGNKLAVDVTKDIIWASPKGVKDPYRTAQLLAPVLHQSVKEVYGKLTQQVPLALLALISPQQGQKVRNLALPGIILDPEPRRAYPEGRVASQMLGFANTYMQGQYGLEGYYNNELAGTAGLRSVIKDTAGNNIHLDTSGPASPSHDGADLHLSIDPTVQGLVEDELAKAVKQHSADGGTIIVMNPRTGYILGMAGNPSFDPNHYGAVKNPQVYQNPATQWTYEPGSTMKILTMAAGLDTHVITPQSSLYDSGQFRVGDTVIHNWSGGGFGEENMTQVLQHSANVGASWVAGRLGVRNFYTYVRRFRLGQPTGIDLAGEEAGILPLPGEKNWSIVNLYTNSFGQGLSITPIQLIHAVAAVANGGVMMKPQVVKRMVYDGRIIDTHPISEGRVISRHTSHTLTNMLLHSAIDGEASMALVKGYNIAAKTGTANIADGHGGYLAHATVASVIGYAPAFHPRFVVLVVIDRPRDLPWGSMVAAPVLHNLFRELFMYYHVPPNPRALNR
jgi:cell division protein FtsI/penicillin-binding protein 2